MSLPRALALSTSTSQGRNCSKLRGAFALKTRVALVLLDPGVRTFPIDDSGSDTTLFRLRQGRHGVWDGAIA